MNLARLLVVCGPLLLTATTAAHAQSAPAGPAGRPGVPPLVLETEDGDNRVQVGLLLQFDGRFVPESVEGVDTFVARRARVPVQGRVARHFEFHLNPDFAGNSVNLRDAYVDLRFSDALRVRVGKAKAPFSLERLQSVSRILFVERGFPAAVAPDRDTGVQVQGTLFGRVLSYAAAIANGTVDGGSVDADANDDKDIIGRFVVQPFARNAAGRLAGLGLAVAGSRGEAPRGLPGFRSAGQQTFFTYAAGAEGVGTRVRLSPQIFLYSGPLGAFAEYVASTGDVQRATAAGLARAEIEHRALHVAVSWVLTGEAASENGVRPRTNFDPEGGGWGAVQIAGRYTELEVSTAVLALGFASPGASRTAEAWAIGANWYLNPFVKWVLNFERTVFDGDPGGPRPAEHAILFRGQLAF